MKKIISAILIISLVLSPAFAATLGENVQSSSVDILDNAKYTHSVFYNGDVGNQTENFITYTPDSGSTPVVAYGSKIYGASTITHVADYLKGIGKYPVAGINADFFSLQTGIPDGIVIIDGRLVSYGDRRDAVAFTDSGEAFIAAPEVKITAYTSGGSFDIDYVNKLRQPYCSYLLTNDFSATTRTSTWGIDVVLDIVSGSPEIDGYVTCVVESVSHNSSAIDIPEGKMVFTVDGKAPEAKYLNAASLLPGEQITISFVATDTRWNDVSFAVGGAKKILSNNQVESNLEAGAAPRSAVGIKPNGDVVFYTIDGRQQGYSYGVQLTTLANRLRELGCSDAINLDGGGSTAITVLYPGYEKLEVVNSPSDGALRACANYIFLVNNKRQTGQFGKLFLYPFEEAVLPGAKISFVTKATDGSTYTVPVPQGVIYSVDGESNITPNGVATFNGEGRTTVYAQSGSVKGRADINIVKNPTSISVNVGNNISPKAGETVNITAKAFEGRRQLIADNECFQWRVEGGVGTITRDGKFTASGFGGGRIVVSAGTTSYVINVAGEHAMKTIEDFENAAGSGALTIEKNGDKVKHGEASGKITYDGDTDLSFKMQPGKETKHVSLWIYGDGSNNNLYLKSGDTESSKVKLDFVGWRARKIEFSSVTTSLTFAVEKTQNGKKSGEIWVDQIIGFSFLPPDFKPVEMEFKPDEYGVSVAMDHEMLDYGSIVAMIDNQRVDFEERGSGIYIDLPRDRTHKVSVLASDIFGNLTRKSYDSFVEQDIAPFADTEGHWASQYIDALFEAEVVSGSSWDDKMYFYPENNITRAEFAILMCNLMGVDVSKYENKVLPFEDADAIPEWATKHVKAMHEAGIINGRNNYDKLYFAPTESITRAEVMTIMGRIVKRGYLCGKLEFTDNDKIPPYATEYIRILESIGAVSGYKDGSIKPNDNVKRAEAAKMAHEIFGAF